MPVRRRVSRIFAVADVTRDAGAYACEHANAGIARRCLLVVERNGQCAAGRVHSVIVRAWAMVDALSTAPSRATLQADELREQFLIVEQVDAP